MKQKSIILALDRKHSEGFRGEDPLSDFADGELCEVYSEFNIETQQWEIALVREYTAT